MRGLWTAFAVLIILALVMLVLLARTIFGPFSPASADAGATLTATAAWSASATPAQPTVQPSTTRTPFQPATATPTVSSTPTASPTFTPTPTATASATRTPKPTSSKPTRTPRPPLPASARIDGVRSFPQRFGLDCETRSAVDWAAFFGVGIDEVEFVEALPKTDNPETGFVGNYNGVFGQIPPYDYGVHAAPVARMLRAYGVQALEAKKLGWDDLQEEIAAGRPVIVWVIGSVAPYSHPVEYTASDGQTTTVAAYEHTVMLIGYDENSATFADNGMVYTRPLEQFLSSWGVLGNMAITAVEK